MKHLDWRIPLHVREQADPYIRRIRNEVKRQYALDYLNAFYAGTVQPERPENLSFMAAQGVRMNLCGMIPDLARNPNY